MSACEDQPEQTYRVNVTNTLRLAKGLRAAGTRIVFLSSNAVFNGKLARPDEDAEHCTSTEYGRQKAAVESGLMTIPEGTGSVAIVRLSKVLSPDSGLAKEFIGKLVEGEPCVALDDLFMSPISLGYVVDALLGIASSNLSGVFHLSGSEEMTYAAFARRLAVHIGVDPALVQERRSTDAGVRVLFRPEHPALGMKRTSDLLNIQPEPTTHLMDKLARKH
jgi:dTDP-4-dehydrorhamnose reductase